ncbi:methylated-DNA--[protein]-cysteine S-methyltransferase [Sandaracinobacter neustonicus]|uniref:methylated-DNA--[protein]-cysteine S-methyltransferase n=1 Tax=Sandaracinobacter neustonicus TaxID=1715348 RepID=A0A501XDT5_9SPHN|nr:methylated-DNA--[protein]-cysteine S-methyltransferase [Sandaracinobacter neustonicus]TPE58788.1 methylated-DNA--[protein]-cysteine S-methyltransferase [Sandaracinobacter neustonicus]
MTFALSVLDTPAGPMALVHDVRGTLWAAEFRHDPRRVETSLARYGIGPLTEGEAPLPPHLADAFGRYFGGELRALESLQTGQVGSKFERAVWAELRRIPPGETRTYGDIARALGGAASGAGPNARAVGTANGRNPLAIVVPCHRVIGADGSLTGYAGGLQQKAWLLAHEGWGASQGSLF